MPRMKNPLVLIVALGCGLVATYLGVRILTKPQDVPEQQAFMVVGAVKDIDQGTQIRKDTVDLLAPPEGVNPDVLFSQFDKVVGRVTRRNIFKGEVIRSVDLMEEGDNPVSLIPPGYRAMTVPVAMSSDLKNFLKIGNRVDVLLTHDTGNNNFETIPVVQNARVIGASDTQKGEKVMNVTLAVKPQGAETLAFAEKKGTLNISIRSQSEEDEERFFTLKEIFFKEKPKEPGQINQPVEQEEQVETEIELIRGVDVEKHSFEENNEPWDI